MVDVTNQYFRYFARLLSKHTVIWNEMIHMNAVIHARKGRHLMLAKSPEESPYCVYQLGGNDAELMAQAAKVVEDHGF